MARLRRADCSGPGFRRVRRGRGLQLPRRGRRPDRGARGRRAHPRAGHPAGLEGRLDLPLGQRPHPGHRRRRGRAASSTSTTRNGAPGATPRSSTRCSTSPRTCRRCASAWRPTSRPATRSRASACWPAPCACWTAGSSASAPRSTRSPTRASGWRRCARRTSKLEDDDTMVFDYPAKSGKRQIRAIVDPLAIEVVGKLKRRRGGGDELLAYKEGRRWHDIRSGDINEYIKEITGGDYSAKDFRTWNATVLAAVALAVSGEVAGHQDRPQAGDHPRRQGGRPLPRQHARGLPRLLHRPARLRRLRGRAHHRARPWRGRRGRRTARWRSTSRSSSGPSRPDRRARGGAGRREDRRLRRRHAA